MQGLKYITAVLIATFLVFAGWSPTSLAKETDLPGQVATQTVQGPLDGLAFRGALGPDGKPKDIPDLFVFANGTFVSRECELRCKYPARPYFVRSNGGKTEFISETRCPYKDATITWRGSIEGDRIRGTSTWVVKRWYWTYENTFEFEGQLTDKPTAAASTD